MALAPEHLQDEKEKGESNMKKKIRGLFRYSKVLILIPLLLLIIFLEEGTITVEALNHWGIHLAACILVCETVHSLWH